MEVLKFSCVSGLNSGDDLISYVIEEEFKVEHSIKSLDIMGLKFDLKSRINSKNIHKVPRNNKYRNHLAGFIRWCDYRLNHRNKFISAIKSSELVIIGGGQIIDDSATGHMLYRIMDIIKICHSLHVPVIISFVGVSQLSSKNFNKLKKLAPYLEKFCVRDSKSLIRLKENNINARVTNLIADPVFNISKWVDLKNTDIKYIGVNIMNLNAVIGVEDQSLETCSRNLIKIALELDLGVRLILTSFGQDLDMARILENHFKNANYPIDIKFVTTPESVTEAYSGVEIMLSHRMHSSIIAMSYGIPCLAYNWHTKVEGLEKLVNSESSILKIHQDINFESHLLLENAKALILQKNNNEFDLNNIKSDIDNYFAEIIKR
ncbi:polysaccharide pyruvyl transferase family protein [Shewanella sp. SR43-4]|uniref:polysaccharide pyruvyl transferase family protein n=1 Tax=Shewanella sp. SR43-4 TaxID=2760942 RepID=UPI0015FB2F4D|nr:polysaccharide pyruvyl transferase family protein [Shewanella sp. SR43-4]MBB1318434.1 polysaccharide pyruvyl transferase family protein [Shewanella sp. SR43-4]